MFSLDDDLRLRQIASDTRELRRAVRLIVQNLNLIETMEISEMSTLTDIKAAADASLAKARAESDALVAIAGVITDYKAKNADLQSQLDAAIANGADPADLQAISDQLKATNDALDANAAAENALANTNATT